MGFDFIATIAVVVTKLVNWLRFHGFSKGTFCIKQWGITWNNHSSSCFCCSASPCSWNGIIIRSVFFSKGTNSHFNDRWIGRDDFVADWQFNGRSPSSKSSPGNDQWEYGLYSTPIMSERDTLIRIPSFNGELEINSGYRSWLASTRSLQDTLSILAIFLGVLFSLAIWHRDKAFVAFVGVVNEVAVVESTWRVCKYQCHEEIETTVKGI